MQHPKMSADAGQAGQEIRSEADGVPRRHQNISAAMHHFPGSFQRSFQRTTVIHCSIGLDRHQYHLKMSLFLNRGGDHEQEQTQKQKEGFLSRVLKHRKDKRTQEGEDDRRPSLRTRYRQKQSENLWGDARRSSCSSRVMRDIKRIHRRLSDSSRKIMNSSQELFASLGLSEGSLDPDQIDAIEDDETGDNKSMSKAKAVGKDEEKGMRRRRSTTRTKTDQKKESAQEETCGDSDLDNSVAPEDGFYGWPSRKRSSIDSSA